MGSRNTLRALGIIAALIWFASVELIIFADDSWTLPCLVVGGIAAVAFPVTIYLLGRIRRARTGTPIRRSRTPLLLAGSLVLLAGWTVLAAQVQGTDVAHPPQSSPPLRSATSITAPFEALTRAIGCHGVIGVAPGDPADVGSGTLSCRRASGAVAAFAIFGTRAQALRWEARIRAMSPTPTIVENRAGTTVAYSRDPAFAADVRAAGGLPD